MLARAYGDPSVLAEEVYARYRDMLLAPGVRRAILARVGQSVLLEPEPLLRRVRAPTLLVWGEKDSLVPFSNAAVSTSPSCVTRLRSTSPAVTALFIRREHGVLFGNVTLFFSFANSPPDSA